MKVFRSPDGIDWTVDVQLTGASNALVVFRHEPDACCHNDVPAFPILAAEAERAMCIMSNELKRRERRYAEMTLGKGSRYADPVGRPG